MKLDLNKLDWAYRENFWWAVVHDLIAHPLLVLTLYSAWARRFHGWTSNKAWPPAKKRLGLPMPPALVSPIIYRWRRNG